MEGSAAGNGSSWDDAAPRDEWTCSYNLTTPLLVTRAEHFREGSRFWIQRVLVPIVVAVGVLGNAVSMVVLTNRRMRSSTNVYLTALAASDLLYLVLVLFLSLEHYPGLRQPEYYAYWRSRSAVLWLADASSNTSIWLTVSFTLERYIAVCHPMRGRMFCTESRARKVILLVYAFCFLTTMSTAFEWTVCAHLRDSQVVAYYRDVTELGDNTTYRQAFYWFTSVTFMLLPFTMLCVFNSFLIYVVHKSRRQRRRMTQVDHTDNTQTQENKITVTLIAVVVLFLVCQMPTVLYLLYITAHEPEPHSVESDILLGLGNVFNFLNAINAASNFILYCAFSDKYRRTFLITFLGRWYRTYARRFHGSLYTSTAERPSSLRYRASSHNNSTLRRLPPPPPSRGGSANHARGKCEDVGAPKQENVISPSNINIPLFESLKFQFLIHGLPVPQGIENHSSSLATARQPKT